MSQAVPGQMQAGRIVVSTVGKGRMTMSEREISFGSQSFRDLREKNKVYIDKTGFISELFSDGSAKVSVITRPRRFG